MSTNDIITIVANLLAFTVLYYMHKREIDKVEHQLSLEEQNNESLRQANDDLYGLLALLERKIEVGDRLFNMIADTNVKLGTTVNSLVASHEMLVAEIEDRNNELAHVLLGAFNVPEVPEATPVPEVPEVTELDRHYMSIFRDLGVSEEGAEKIRLAAHQIGEDLIKELPDSAFDAVFNGIFTGNENPDLPIPFVPVIFDEPGLPVNPTMIKTWGERMSALGVDDACIDRLIKENQAVDNNTVDDNVIPFHRRHDDN